MTDRLEAARPCASGEAGFALLEAVASLAVLAIVVLAVLSGMEGAQSSSAREKRRAVASGLAEQDQERLRSLPGARLEALTRTAQPAETQTLTVDGVDYKVESSAWTVTDADGATASCVNDGRNTSYLRIKSSVGRLYKSPTESRMDPVVVSSLLTPQVGSMSKGTLAVQVNDRKGDGVSGMPVSIAPANAPAVTTNSVGCAIFAQVPVGAYTATASAAGWVAPDGATTATRGTTVVSGKVSVLTLVYDRAGSIAASFDTERSGVRSERASALTVEHSDMPGAVRTFPASAPPASSIAASGLFPFEGAYGVFSGRCQAQSPLRFDPDYFKTHSGAVEVAPGGAHSVTVREPALNIELRRGSSSSWRYLPNSTQRTVHVQARFTASDGSGCTDTQRFTGNYTGASDVWPDGTTVPGSAPGTLKEPGTPFGVWNVCVDDGSGHRHDWTIDNTDPAGTPATPLRLRDSDTGPTCW